jgi:hypothetical protein
VDPQGYIFASGAFTGQSRYGQETLVSAGAADLFLMRMTDDGSVRIPRFQLEEGDLTSWVHYPNPAGDQSQVRFALARNAEIQLDLLDLQGRAVKSVIPAQRFPAGTHQRSVSLQGLADGLYLYRLRVGERALTGKLVVQH